MACTSGPKQDSKMGGGGHLPSLADASYGADNHCIVLKKILSLPDSSYGPAPAVFSYLLLSASLPPLVKSRKAHKEWV